MSSTSSLFPLWVKVVGAGAESVTSVRCDPNVTTVDDLKKLVKVECSPKLDHIAALDLIVKGADGATIEEDALVTDRAEGRNKADAFIVFVDAPSAVHETRKRRWERLNTVLDINKRAKIKNGHFSLGYSYASWEQVKDFFSVAPGKLQTTTGEGLSQPLLIALHQYLSFATICFGSISEGHKAKRVHFIAPIIIIVCSFFRGGIQILAEEDIEGNRIHAHGHFEFVLKRGDKRICIVEAKNDDILQGKTQSLIGCESLCDVEDLSVSYGIATNYLEWCFLKDEADKITEEMLTVSLEEGRPTIESLRSIANKIIAILE